ncbi:type II toxin-antitoxin system RelE/ParE family toxin [Persicobacter psychrovividus]|uniref:Type II toxin-antitoxin system RelE/ParE family toxin n=1 Tax=Persicobacter psychrovividus TaxID=387638 RepID=A0ABN6L7B9_9BACT|nr:hypothetical protein PEPS_13700 [Persicobacter psychrovividus]
MFLQKTKKFDKWLRKLNDMTAKVRILARIRAIELDDHWGDYKQLAPNLRELRIDISKGYRIYIQVITTDEGVILEAGTKSGQQNQIKEIKKGLRNGNK